MKNIKTFEGFFSKLLGKGDVISDCQKMIVKDDYGIISVDADKGTVVFLDKGNPLISRQTFAKQNIVYADNPVLHVFGKKAYVSRKYKEGDEEKTFEPRKEPFRETVGRPILPRVDETSGKSSEGGGREVLVIPGGEILKKWLKFRGMNG